MLKRGTILAILTLGLSSLAPTPTLADAEVVATGVDTTRLDPQARIAGIRAAYENAWAQRQAGEFDTAIELCDGALVQAEEGLSLDPDMTTRRDLTELRSRLKGLRAAARHDRAEAASARASGNELDDRVLNAPAAEEIEPQINADVLRWIEYYTDPGRSTFERWLKRSGRYVDLFRSVLKKEGLPPDLVQLVYVESGFNLYARSRSAAVGPWQFMRSTGRLFGLTVNKWVDERKDPEKSTVAAARYLKHLYSIFQDWPLALASYNAGEGTVLRAIKRQGTTNYWDLRLPRQTEDYVPQFMAVLAISRDPEKYGFDAVEMDDPIEFDEIAFQGAIDLRALARLADCEVSELKELNPAVLRHATRGPGGVTTLRVPRGKGELLLERLQEGAQLPAVDLKLKHRVRRGETLQKIANQYHVDARRLARTNGIGRKRPLRRGMVLTIRTGATVPVPAELDEGDPRASTAYVPLRKIRTPASLDGKSDASGRMTIRVHRGQTLGTIAQTYGVTVKDLMRWNRLKSTRLRAGTRLKVRTEEAAQAFPSAADSAQIAKLVPPKARRSRSIRWVVVRRGDTLSAIAHRHGVSVEAIRRANRLPSTRIRAGQKLKVPRRG